jgi:chromosome partitioning protein
VLNLADSGPSPDNTDAAAALAEFPALQLVDAPIRRRKAFASAAAHGLAIDELTPIDLKACHELSTLAKMVFQDDTDRLEA